MTCTWPLPQQYWRPFDRKRMSPLLRWKRLSIFCKRLRVVFNNTSQNTHSNPDLISLKKWVIFNLHLISNVNDLRVFFPNAAIDPNYAYLSCIPDFKFKCLAIFCLSLRYHCLHYLFPIADCKKKKPEENDDHLPG